MANQRPPLWLVEAKKLEIRRRYAHKGKVGKRTRSMAAIRLSELTRWLDYTSGAGALKPSEHSILIARIFAHHLGGLPDSARRIDAWLNHYAPWLDIPSRERLISQVNECQIKWSADKLAWKIGLTDQLRTNLKIRTIGAIDCTKEQRKERRKRQHAERQKRLRAAKRAQHID